MKLVHLALCVVLTPGISSCTGSVSGGVAADPTGGDGMPSVPGASGDAGRGTTTKPGSAGAGGTSANTPPPIGPSGTTAGLRPLWRLTRTELNNTIAQLLGDKSRAADDLPADVTGDNGFLAGNNVSTVDAERLATMAETLASNAAAKLDTLLGCNPSATGEAACAKTFITTFGKRAYRRPLEPSEITALSALYDRARTQIGLDFKTSMGFVLQAILQSPSFLYHWEVSPKGSVRDGGLVKLSPYELASRLSFFVLQSMPDDALFDAADQGRLTTATDVERETRRLLATPAAKPALLDFHQQWLKLVGVAGAVQGTVFPAATAQAANAEISAFIDYVLSDAGAGNLSTLLSAPIGFVNADLAKIYGLQNITGTNTRKVDLDPTQRAGIFTQAGFLALNAKGLASEPIYRGVVLLERVLCEQKPPPLAAVPELAAPTANASTRQRHIEHQTNPVCVTCHQSFEPLGFAFEHYDGVGRFRTQDGGKDVDATGTVTTVKGKETFTFKNAVDLAKQLAASPQVHACMAKKVFRFASGTVEADADKAALDGALAHFESKNLDVRELIVAIAKSSSFLYRAPSSGEALQ